MDTNGTICAISNALIIERDSKERQLNSAWVAIRLLCIFVHFGEFRQCNSCRGIPLLFEFLDTQLFDVPILCWCITDVTTRKVVVFSFLIDISPNLNISALYHEPINHGLATPFLSYRVTLNARKTRDFIRDLIIWQSYKLGPLRQCSDS